MPVVIAAFVCSTYAQTKPAPLPPKTAAMLATITPANLKGDLSFLASDALRGRYTPSPELTIAAEFIAAQFRAEGLEPGGNDGYFQMTEMVDRKLPSSAPTVLIRQGGRQRAIASTSVAVFDSSREEKIEEAPVVVFATRELAALEKTSLTGKAVVVRGLDFHKMSSEQARAEYQKARDFDRRVSASDAAVEIVVEENKPQPVHSRLLAANEAARRQVPVIRVASEEMQNWLAQPAKAQDATLSLTVPAPEDQTATLKNVIGLLRGSDPNLKQTYVLVTAHYDHIGTSETAGPYLPNEPKDGETDHIYNGANDDGSGTVSVIEIARAFATLRVHPKRSVVFMTFFGEERGEYGSRFYGGHPAFPVPQTVADVNLEQVGRTDATNGKQVNTASLTGYDYSDVPKFLEQAGRQTGIRVYKDPEASDAYFVRSDNDALAEQGVPAHTLTVAFDYPDYHGLGDEWQKVDYDNMARVDRMVALGVLNIANSVQAPQWDATNPKTAPFRHAQAALAAPKTSSP